MLMDLIKENERLFTDGAVAVYTMEDNRYDFWNIFLKGYYILFLIKNPSNYAVFLGQF
jgi:hypothetical protein